MQALYQPPTQKPLSVFNTQLAKVLPGNTSSTQKPLSVFNTQQVTYKTKYTTTYDIALLANNIKAQKVVPLYELDADLYETLRRIFVQQPTAAEKTAGADNKNGVSET